MSDDDVTEAQAPFPDDWLMAAIFSEVPLPLSHSRYLTAWLICIIQAKCLLMATNTAVNQTR